MKKNFTSFQVRGFYVVSFICTKNSYVKPRLITPHSFKIYVLNYFLNEVKCFCVWEKIKNSHCEWIIRLELVVAWRTSFALRGIDRHIHLFYVFKNKMFHLSISDCNMVFYLFIYFVIFRYKFELSKSFHFCIAF